jgi:hypothetical protein
MSFIGDIKYRVGKYFLGRKKEHDRKVETRNFDLSRSIGLLFKAESESDFILVKQYRKHLQSEYGIKSVEALGWISTKEMPDYTVTQRGFTFLNPTLCNWYLQPEGADYEAFINLPFDILIDLTFEEVITLRFALKQSKALMKVGRYHKEDYDLYDLTLNLPENTLLDEYLKQTDKYLNIIKP